MQAAVGSSIESERLERGQVAGRFDAGAGLRDGSSGQAEMVAGFDVAKCRLPRFGVIHEQKHHGPPLTLQHQCACPT